MKGKNILFTVIVAAGTTFASLFAYNRFAGDKSALQPAGSNPYRLTSTSFPVAPDGMAPVDFTYAAALSTPSVVHVKTTYEHTTTSQSNDVFRQFFGDDFYGQPQPEMASGSGVIISDDGYIVTNYHVVKNADKIQVVLYDKEKADATVIGTDPSTDVALIKIDMKNLSPMRMGNSDSVRVGQWVLAVGNPFDLTSTVTAGIVSAKGRKIDILGENSSTPVESFIQTDAAVNPGNSGGALVDLQGNLIGINTAIATPTGTFAGYSFAVPVNIVKKTVNDILKYGVVQRAYLGVEVDMSKDDVGGVYVASVVDGSGAAEGGIKVGDIITDINNAPIHSFPELQEQISKYGPGDKVNVNVVRDGNRKNLVVELKNKKGNTSLITKESNSEVTSLGIETEDLSSSQLKQYDIDGGIEVRGIHNGAVAQQTRIREGFIITTVDGTTVHDSDDLARILNNKEGSSIIIEGFYPEAPNRIYNYGLNL